MGKRVGQGETASGGSSNYSVEFSCFIAIFSIFFHNLLRLFVCHLSCTYKLRIENFEN